MYLYGKPIYLSSYLYKIRPVLLHKITVHPPNYLFTSENYYILVYVAAIQTDREKWSSCMKNYFICRDIFRVFALIIVPGNDFQL